MSNKITTEELGSLQELIEKLEDIYAVDWAYIGSADVYDDTNEYLGTLVQDEGNFYLQAAEK